MRILRRRTLERRLFFWLLGLAIVPALLVLAVTSWVGRGTLDWFGTLGPWTAVSQTGSELIDAAQARATADTTLLNAATRHHAELERSVVQAQRWSYLGGRLLSILPIALIGFALVLAITALLISRKLARELSRPIQELEAWTERIARAEPLPEPTRREKREVREVQALRQSLRRAATDLQNARERALQQERTRAWGELARRIAHEMKNPLTPIRLAAHRLQQKGEQDPSIAEALRVVDTETARLEILAREFSMLGRPADGPRSIIDVTELLRDLLATDVPASVATELDAPDELNINGDYNAVQQGFRNVIRNAVEAVEHRPQPQISAQIRSNGDHVAVTINDNGPGLPDHGDRIFEPDFTTKRHGTGLGLTIVRQTIEAHGGTVTAAQRPEGGASITISIPRATTT